MSAAVTRDHVSGSVSGHAVSPRRAALLDTAVIGAWFTVLGVLGAVVWWQVTTLPLVTRSGGTVSVAPEELVKQVAVDGWFAVVALVGGVVSGVLLLAWRHRDPLLTVVLVVLGAGLAAVVMMGLGRLLGPGDPVAALRSMSEGAEVSQQLRLHAPGIALLWPIAAAFGAVVHLWVLAKPLPERPEVDTLE